MPFYINKAKSKIIIFETLILFELNVYCCIKFLTQTASSSPPDNSGYKYAVKAALTSLLSPWILLFLKSQIESVLPFGYFATAAL